MRARNKPLKFYCAGPIRGESFFKEYFDRAIDIVKEFGIPLTEKVAHKLYPIERYINKQTAWEKLVAERDRKMIRQSHAIIAEVSGGSTGTGWEICYATRLYRKPTLCLYHEKSFPSLIIKQDSCIYTIPQIYSDESQFESYVRCFLETVTRVNNIGEIRKIYLKSREIAKLSPHPDKIKRHLKRLVKTIPKKVDLDFTDANQFVRFLFRNLILQRRWKNLKSQRIGASFVGGRKSRIIKVLSRFEHPIDILEIYEREEDRIKYTREAFTKNVRAFRKIGLVEFMFGKAEPTKRGTKFKDQIMLVKTLAGKIETRASRSSRVTASSIIVVTQHLRHLSNFLDRFGSRSLVSFLRRSEQMGWYSEIPEISIHDIDKIEIDAFLNEKWAQKVVKNLGSEGQRLWKIGFSSFA